MRDCFFIECQVRKQPPHTDHVDCGVNPASSITADHPRAPGAESQGRAIINFMRNMVLMPPSNLERFHALFVDDKCAYLGDLPLGEGSNSSLSLRMRDLFSCALGLSARGVVVAHNHPSGLCRPSQNDIAATNRLKSIALALDIELLDHLIFTQSAVYSMRAGGNL